MLEGMLIKENIRIIYEKLSWEEAVMAAVTPLVLTGFVEERYGEAIIDGTKKYGAYYILTKDIALLHSRPEKGVKKRQIGITLVKEGVYFPDNTAPVRLLMVLAAEANDGHIEVMRDIAELVINERMIGEILKADSPDVIFDLLQ